MPSSVGRKRVVTEDILLGFYYLGYSAVENISTHSSSVYNVITHYHRAGFIFIY